CVISMTAGGAYARYSGGTGEPNDPYRIATAEDLNDIGNHIEDLSKCFVMVNDVNLAEYTGSQFNIIGKDVPYFSGIFDGNGHQITKFTYIDETDNRIGIFGRTTGSSEIRNIDLTDVNLCGYYDVGGLVGKNYGKIENCSVTGVIFAQYDFGGLVGENRGWLERCNSNVTIGSNGLLSSYVGCLVGWNADGDIIDCSSSGEVVGDNNTDYAGGLAGA
ncbi:MAG: GLUG motif-containing protein, partial [Planctomycetota bacterium]